MGFLRGLNSAEPPADEHHRQGQRPGPAPNAKNQTGVRETQKRGVVRQARRASRSAAFGLRPGTGAAGFIGKRRAVSSVQAAGSQAPDPSALVASRQLPPRHHAVSMRTLPLAAVSRLRMSGQVRTRSRPPLASISPAYRNGLVRQHLHEERADPEISGCHRRANGRVSARASRGPARSGSRRRPRRSPRWWQASAHRDRCRAASIITRPRETSRTSATRAASPARQIAPGVGPAAVLALGLSGSSGASMLAMRTRSRPQRMVSPSWTRRRKQRAAAARTTGIAIPSAAACRTKPSLFPTGPDRHPKGRHSCRRGWAGGGARAPTARPSE
jgi:hypothetical protein